MSDMDVFSAMGIAGFGKAPQKRQLDPRRFDKNIREEVCALYFICTTGLHADMREKFFRQRKTFQAHRIKLLQDLRRHRTVLKLRKDLPMIRTATMFNLHHHHCQGVMSCKRNQSTIL